MSDSILFLRHPEGKEPMTLREAAHNLLKTWDAPKGTPKDPLWQTIYNLRSALTMEEASDHEDEDKSDNSDDLVKRIERLEEVIENSDEALGLLFRQIDRLKKRLAELEKKQ